MELKRSGVAGVLRTRNNKKWAATLGIDKKIIRIGTFKTLDEAVIARYTTEKKLYKNLYIGLSPAEKYLIRYGILKH